MPFKDIAKKLSQEIRELADNAGDPITMEWKTGEVIIEKGKTGNYMYLVVSGEAEIRVGDEVLEVVERDGIIGEMALIDSPMRSATVIASSDIALTPIDRWKFLYLTRRQPEFALYIMEVMSRRLRMMNERMGEDGQPGNAQGEQKTNPTA